MSSLTSLPCYTYISVNIRLLPQQVSHLNPVLHLQLPNNCCHLVPHRKRGGAQPLGNLLVSQPLGYQGYYFLFLTSKLIHPTPASKG